MDICERHQKEIQAFCDDECLPLCIDCILEQARHKSHKVENVADAAKKARRNLESQILALKKAESGYTTAVYKAQEFRAAFETFRIRVANRIRFAQLKALKIVSEGFSELISKSNKKLDNTLANAERIFYKNDEEQGIIKVMRTELEERLNDLSSTSLLKYYSSQFIKIDFDKYTKRMSPNSDPWSSKDSFNEYLFTHQEIQRTIDRIKLDLSAKPSVESLKAVNNFTEKRPPPQANDFSRGSFDDQITVTNEQLMTIAQGFKDILKKTNLSFVVNDSDLKLNLLETAEMKYPDFSETHRRKSSPQPITDYQSKPMNRNSVSHRHTSLKSVQSEALLLKHQSHELTEPIVPERVIIIGGKKSKNFSFRFMDLGLYTITSRKISFPPIKKHGSVYLLDSLFFFGGKIGNKASDKIFKYNPKLLTLEDQVGFSLCKKKSDFAYTAIDEHCVLLFGGKDEMGFAIYDIELLDFKGRSSKLIGKMPLPKSGMSAVKVEASFALVPPSEPRKTVLGHPNLSSLKPKTSELSLPQMAETISFEISDINEKIGTVSNFNYSFEQSITESPVLELHSRIPEDLMTVCEDQKFDLSECTLEFESQIVFEATQPRFDDFVILLIGGKSASKNILTSVDIYYPKRKVIQPFAELKQARKTFCTILSDDGLYVFGGRTANGLLKSIERIERGNCKIVGQMSIEKEGFRGIYRRNEYILIGGEGHKGSLDLIEHMTIENGTAKLVKKLSCSQSLSFYDLLKVDYAENLI